ncbi:MAG: flavin reductase family protein [Chitinophagaceae bacterium]
MVTKDMSAMTVQERQYFLQHLVAPRPICFASTIDAAGHVNLSPFSFFNLFGTNPPIVIFSPSRRVRNGTTKHTLENVLEVPEVVINIVTYDMVQQMSLASCEYSKGVDEFVKAGFTPEPATLVKPPMVKESPAKMECRVLEVKPIGSEGGAANLVICEVLRLHISEALLGEDGRPVQQKIDHVARLGADWYCRVGTDNLFRVEKPNVELGIGIDALPPSIRNSRVLTGNHLGQLGNVHHLPEIDPTYDDPHLRQIFQYYSLNPDEMEKEIHRYAASLLDHGQVQQAWQVLLLQA